jgi:hypothetical protein
MSDPMDQRSITYYLAMKGLSATNIQKDLKVTFDFKAIAYSTVTYYMRTLSFRVPNKVPDNVSEEYQVTEIDQAILKTLADKPFSSVHELTRHTYLSKSTSHRHLTCSLSFTIRYLH